MAADGSERSGTLSLKDESDIVQSRAAVRKLAVRLKFSLVEQTKMITAASELARNTVVYGNSGEMRWEVLVDDIRNGATAFRGQRAGHYRYRPCAVGRLDLRQRHGRLHGLLTQFVVADGDVRRGDRDGQLHDSYTEKTDNKLDGIVFGLKDEYQVVRIVRAGDIHTRAQLVVEGATGVGDEQAKACHACDNFGAAVSGLPDSLGRVFGGQCFDIVCNQQKVAARLKAEKDAKTAPAKAGKSTLEAPEQ